MDTVTTGVTTEVQGKSHERRYVLCTISKIVEDGNVRFSFEIMNKPVLSRNPQFAPTPEPDAGKSYILPYKGDVPIVPGVYRVCIKTDKEGNRVVWDAPTPADVIAPVRFIGWTESLRAAGNNVVIDDPTADKNPGTLKSRPYIVGLWEITNGTYAGTKFTSIFNVDPKTITQGDKGANLRFLVRTVTGCAQGDELAALVKLRGEKNRGYEYLVLEQMILKAQEDPTHKLSKLAVSLNSSAEMGKLSAM